jgi:hypothetical protein
MGTNTPLVPRPRVHLTRFHGVFAPNSHLRAAITPAEGGSGSGQREGETPEFRHRAMTSMQRLKRVFKIDIETCGHCGGTLRSSPASKIRR